MSLQNLKEGLKKGLYVRNLHRLADICYKEALAGNSPAPFFILAGIFKEIAACRDEMPVKETPVRSIEQMYNSPAYICSV